jgi:prepilin-type N-terminal cleavage/methylation domain-containing protein
MNRRVQRFRSGFTLLELMASVLIMGVISAVLLPVISASSDAYTVTREIRANTENMAFAIDRIARIIREAPIGTDSTGLGVQTATVSTITFTDGTGFELDTDGIMMLVPGESPTLLCPDVDSIQIQYFASDGVTSTLVTPTETHRIVVTITTGQLQMSIVAFPRVWFGQGGTT